MNYRRIALVVWLGLLAVGLAACTQKEQGPAGSTIEEKQISLAPRAVSVKLSFLSGELKDLTIVERVRPETNVVVTPPELHATLNLTNSSNDRTVRLVGGRIEYVDAQGKPIPLAEGRQDTNFTFLAYQERLDPGMAISQGIQVPFPAVGLKEKTLRDIRLELSYVPMPYVEEAASVRVSVADQS
ncbi:MAG TPA: hypothetical protein VJO34_06260 [Methylomirabilota bacterium]|nr:hypothetical protein [Methylomirabilota bacterium]